MTMKIDLPWWLQNQLMRHLRKIAETCWGMMIGKLDLTSRLAHASLATPTAINILWEELPIKPEIPFENRKEFILNYDTYLDTLTTRAGIMATKEQFGLDVFEMTPLGELYPESYPWFALRFRVTWDEEKIPRVRDYLKKVVPARCVFHLQLVPAGLYRGFGRTPFGRSFGR